MNIYSDLIGYLLRPRGSVCLLLIDDESIQTLNSFLNKLAIAGCIKYNLRHAETSIHTRN